jgi:hypothetical protein
MSSPVIFTDLRKRLFNNIEAFTERSIHKTNPIRPYRIAESIPYDQNRHWTVYDFVNSKIYKKQQDRANLMFNIVTNVYRDQDGNPGPENMAEYIAAVAPSTGVMLDCALEHKSLLVLFDKSFAENDVDRMLYSVYQTYLLDSVQLKTDADIAACEYKLVPTMNWVWFRKPGAYLSTHIPKRAQSWITKNPEIQFHLWTDLKDADDLADFFRDIPNSAEFLSQITVHYREELWALAREFCETHGGVSWSEYEWVLNINDDAHSIVFKTDSVRTVILAMKGGWYSDFNDTYCFTPLKYIVDNTADEHCYIGCDDDEVTNNYILYAPLAPHNASWIEKTREVMNNSITLAKLFKDERNVSGIVDIYDRTRAALCTALETNPQNTVTETIIPVFGPFMDELNKLFAENFSFLSGAKFDSKFYLDAFTYALKRVIPDSPILARIQEEGTEIARLQFTDPTGQIAGPRFGRRRRPRPPVEWKKPFEAGWKPDAGDLEKLRNVPLSRDETMLTMAKGLIQRIMEKTNIGVVYLREQTPLKEAAKRSNTPYKNPIRIVMFCYLYGIYTFLTCIGHIGDGTCTGSKWEGKEEDYL